MSQNKNFGPRYISTLVIISMILIGFSGVFSTVPLAEVNISPSIYVEKQVWGGLSYVDSTEVNEGDIVEFKVVIYNPYDFYEIHWSGIIYDQLPCNLIYINNSVADLPLEYDHPTIDPEQYCMSNNTVIWQVDRESPILPHHYLNFTYRATAKCCGSEYLENVLTVSPSELIHVCDPTDIIYNDGSLDVSDSASVKVICDEPSIKVEKKVNNYGSWEDETTIYEGDNVEFRLQITNNGQLNLTSVQVTDTLPSILVYNYDANISPDSANDHQITWIIDQLTINETVEIQFSAVAVAVGQADNIVTVDSCQGASDIDDAHVMVSGMIVEKKIWDQNHQTWVDELDTSVNDLVKFKIIVSYIGNGSYTLYNIHIKDELPECLEYRDNANPEPTMISDDGKTIWWNLTDHVSSGGHLSVEFTALVNETSGCGPCINHAIVSANECSGHFFIKEDTATVNAECPVVADAGEPYSGDINEQILIVGDASGGLPPYTYKWDLDDDGYFDDYDGKSLYYSWAEDGTYLISLKVFDSVNRHDVDTTSVTIYPPDNQPPTKPVKPIGETDGSINEDYSYSTWSDDPNDDLIRYGWDWNADDVVDEWTGFYESGEQVTTLHSWSEAGSYNVKVKAEDEYGEQSDFSMSLSVVIDENQAPNKPILMGPSSGRIEETYSYSSSTLDPEDDQLYYLFDWGDGTNSGWKGPFSSGQTIVESHTWHSKGSYSIKVKAKDESGLESVWSDSITVAMPKKMIFSYSSFFDFFQRISEILSHNHFLTFNFKIFNILNN